MEVLIKKSVQKSHKKYLHSIEICPKCGQSGYLYVRFMQNINTNHFSGPIFFIKHNKVKFDKKEYDAFRCKGTPWFGIKNKCIHCETVECIITDFLLDKDNLAL